MKAKFIVLLLLLVAVIGCNSKPSIKLKPNTITFRKRVYHVEYGAKETKIINTMDSLLMKSDGSDQRHLSPCPSPALIVLDVDLDEKEDVCYYDCGYMKIYINGESNLSQTTPILLQYKEEHWIDKTPNRNINLDKLKGLEKIKNIIRQIDPDV